MRTLFFLLFPVLAMGQTFEMKMIGANDSFYPAKGSWEISEETVIVTQGRITDVYTIQGIVDPKIPNAWKCLKGKEKYGIAYFVLDNGTHCLYVSAIDYEWSRTYFGFPED